MNWIILVGASVLFDSIRIFIDNYTSDTYFNGRHAAAQKIFYAYAFILFSIVLLPISGVDFTSIDPAIILLFIASGILSSIAGIPYYKALEIDNSTNLGIFIQIAPIIYLVAGWMFFGDPVLIKQLIAIPIILAAPTIIVMSARKNSRKTTARAIFFSFIYVLISVIGNLVFIQGAAAVPDLSFVALIAFLLFGKGLGNLVSSFIFPKWRPRFRQVIKSSQCKVFRPLVINTLVGVVKDFTYRGALTVAPSVALVSATADSTEPIAIFFMGIVLTLIWPKFGRENLSRKTVFVHLIATVLVIVSIILLQN